ncbi:MAG: methenyltetrahydromethanopterin cyclohydrolase [Methylohalobius sp.]|nr:methenyltetrahydromethanopterin cyclohydrolase [Methylohalobius sp.]
MTKHVSVSINLISRPKVLALIQDAAWLKLKVCQLDNGVTLVDAGIEAEGGLEAGRRIAEICMGGLGTVTLTHSFLTKDFPLRVHVHASDPVLSCLGSQYAGWSLAYGEGKEKFYALGSGPARALCVKEALFRELNYQDHADASVLVIETDKFPPLALLEKIAVDCKIKPESLTVILTPTQSLAGGVQVVARVLEVALHKAHELGFPLERIRDGFGSAPVSPPAADFVTAMGRTNDAILFGGQVHLFVTGSDEEAQSLAQRLPSSTSRDYGKPFAQVFKEYNYDFFQIDPMLFSPASVMVTALDSGRSFRAGRLDEELLARSFGA